MGGGEKYIGKIAEILSRENEISFIVFSQPDFKELETRLGIDLSRVAVNNIGGPALLLPPSLAAAKKMALFLAKRIFSPTAVNTYRVSKCTRKYDLFMNQEHETFIPSHSTRSFLICEVPPRKQPLLRRIVTGLLFDPKATSYDKIVVNSYFTKKWVEKYYRREAEVLYPPIDTNSFIPSSKQNIILSVGRFCTALHCKKQLEMVKSFRKLCVEHDLKDWAYHLVGGLGSTPRDRDYFVSCQEEVRGLSVYFHANATLEVLKELYGKARIFWHATGLGEDENEHPECMEHFGITTVEAMAAGCVPVVINKGGQPEIVQNRINGFLFDTSGELIDCTIKLIRDEALWKKMSEACIIRSQQFSLINFEKRVEGIFSC